MCYPPTPRRAPPIPFPRLKRSCLRSAAFPGCTPTASLRKCTCRKPGSGCAFLDYDNDGWMDIYLVNSGPCDFYTPPSPLRNALYETIVTAHLPMSPKRPGVGGNAYGMGVAVGDYDARRISRHLCDAISAQHPVSQQRRRHVYRCHRQAGVAAPGWATSAVWFDYDNDGQLDLFVCRFADFDKAKNICCGIGADRQAILLHAQRISPMPSWLFHNNGDGTFTDVSKESGIAQAPWPKPGA